MRALCFYIEIISKQIIFQAYKFKAVVPLTDKLKCN